MVEVTNEHVSWRNNLKCFVITRSLSKNALLPKLFVIFKKNLNINYMTVFVLLKCLDFGQNACSRTGS